jgi:hypothetical protein
VHFIKLDLVVDSRFKLVDNIHVSLLIKVPETISHGLQRVARLRMGAFLGSGESTCRCEEGFSLVEGINEGAHTLFKLIGVQGTQLGPGGDAQANNAGTLN